MGDGDESEGGRARPPEPPRHRVGAPLVAWDPTPLGPGDLAAGDLVLVRADATGPGALARDLDGCAFDHVGVLVDGPRPAMWSTPVVAGASLLRPGAGGLRRLDLAELGPGRVSVAPLALDADRRAAGLARLDRWAARDATAARSPIPLVARLAVAVALVAVRRRDPLTLRDATRMWDAARRTVEALPGGDEVPAGAAEAVAAAYRLSFPVGALRVPDGEPHPHGVTAAAPPDDGASASATEVGPTTEEGPVDDDLTPGAVADRVGAVASALAEAGLDGRQVAATVGLLFAVVVHDDDHAARLAAAALDLRHRADPHRARPGPGLLPPRRYVPPPFLPPASDALPAAMVTPRMLLSADVVTAVHPLARPS